MSVASLDAESAVWDDLENAQVVHRMTVTSLRALVGDPDRLRPRQVRDETTDRNRGPRIRCPLCAWEPKRDDMWSCTCLHVWHTFDTGGRCPSCQHQWERTMCLQCHEWSKHRAWYADGDEPAGDGPSPN